MSDFDIPPRLRADCHSLGRYALCHLLLHRNAAVPWFILVPETDLPDLLDLPPAERDAAVAESAAVAAFVKDTLGWPKVNFGAIGNLVPQLHLHVVGRRPVALRGLRPRPAPRSPPRAGCPTRVRASRRRRVGGRPRGDGAGAPD